MDTCWSRHLFQWWQSPHLTVHMLQRTFVTFSTTSKMIKGRCKNVGGGCCDMKQYNTKWTTRITLQSKRTKYSQRITVRNESPPSATTLSTPAMMWLLSNQAERGLLPNRNGCWLSQTNWHKNTSHWSAIDKLRKGKSDKWKYKTSRHDDD